MMKQKNNMRRQRQRRRINDFSSSIILLFVILVSQCLAQVDLTSQTKTQEQVQAAKAHPSQPQAQQEQQQQQRQLAGLAEMWNITGPLFNYSSLGFDLSFIVSDFIADDMISHEIYDENCKEGGVLIPQTVLSGVILVDNTPVGIGNQTREVGVDIVINPETITNSSIYSEQVLDNQLIGTIRYCHRIMLSTQGYSPVVVNYLETIVTLTVDLTDGFDIGQIGVDDKDAAEVDASDSYGVDGFQCDYNNAPLDEIEIALARSQGSLIRVCVRPDERARMEAIYMRTIDNFAFQRDYGPGTGLVTQEAVVDTKPAANLLTTMECTPGSDVCWFETLLMAIFYRYPGTVDGFGIASLQFGSNMNTSRQRNLLRGSPDDHDHDHDDSNNNQRDLQPEDTVGTIAATARFELEMDLIPRPDRYAYTSSAPPSILRWWDGAIATTATVTGLTTLMTLFLGLY